MKYIDAEKLIAEIERRIAILKGGRGDYAKGSVDADMGILEYIESLQQEPPEVNLDFRVFAKEMDAVFNLPKEVTENTEENPLNWEYAIARHFYELGLNARKEESK